VRSIVVWIIPIRDRRMLNANPQIRAVPNREVEYVRGSSRSLFGRRDLGPVAGKASLPLLCGTVGYAYFAFADMV
jgi:hypothetical protein